jgi:hypothetical protein
MSSQNVFVQTNDTQIIGLLHQNGLCALLPTGETPFLTSVGPLRTVTSFEAYRALRLSHQNYLDRTAHIVDEALQLGAIRKKNHFLLTIPYTTLLRERSKELFPYRFNQLTGARDSTDVAEAFSQQFTFKNSPYYVVMGVNNHQQKEIQGAVKTFYPDENTVALEQVVREASANPSLSIISLPTTNIVASLFAKIPYQAYSMIGEPSQALQWKNVL